MWNYEKRLEYPINIKQTDPAMAAMIISTAVLMVNLARQCATSHSVIQCRTVRLREY